MELRDEHIVACVTRRFLRLCELSALVVGLQSPCLAGVLGQGRPRASFRNLFSISSRMVIVT
jgi:hypothetical protein